MHGEREGNGAGAGEGDGEAEGWVEALPGSDIPEAAARRLRVVLRQVEGRAEELCRMVGGLPPFHRPSLLPAWFGVPQSHLPPSSPCSVCPPPLKRAACASLRHGSFSLPHPRFYASFDWFSSSLVRVSSLLSLPLAFSLVPGTPPLGSPAGFLFSHPTASKLRPPSLCRSQQPKGTAHRLASSLCCSWPAGQEPLPLVTPPPWAGALELSLPLTPLPPGCSALCALLREASRDRRKPSFLLRSLASVLCAGKPPSPLLFVAVPRPLWCASAAVAPETVPVPPPPLFRSPPPLIPCGNGLDLQEELIRQFPCGSNASSAAAPPPSPPTSVQTSASRGSGPSAPWLRLRRPSLPLPHSGCC